MRAANRVAQILAVTPILLHEETKSYVRFATVQKLCSHLAILGADQLVSASALVCVCLPDAHSAWHADQFETGSNHTDQCDATARPSPASGQTSPLHAPTHTPNSSPAASAPNARASPDGFCECESRDFCDWQTCFQSGTAADTALRLHSHRTRTLPARWVRPDSCPRCRATAPGHTVRQSSFRPR